MFCDFCPTVYVINSVPTIGITMQLIHSFVLYISQRDPLGPQDLVCFAEERQHESPPPTVSGNDMGQSGSGGGENTHQG